MMAGEVRPVVSAGTRPVLPTSGTASTCETGRVRLRIDLAYDGTGFAGWAAQPGLRTVQGELEAALARVLRLVRLAEFKRKQAAPGIKVTDRAFGTGWRMPIAARLT